MKWRYPDIYNHFQKEGQDFNKIFDSICDLVAKTFLAVDDKFADSLNSVPCHRNNAFELFGFDILLDEDLKPWLIEVCKLIN
jgi:hypothetical protein